MSPIGSCRRARSLRNSVHNDNTVRRYLPWPWYRSRRLDTRPAVNSTSNLRFFFLFPVELRLAAIGLGWKSVTPGSQVTIAAGDIKYVQWLRCVPLMLNMCVTTRLWTSMRRVARNFQLRIILKDNRRRETFDGFQREVSIMTVAI